MTYTCEQCKSDYIFERPENSHFRCGICMHCQRENENGSFLYEVVLKDTRDGHTITKEFKHIRSSDGLEEDMRNIEYLWEEGNNACDCNRAGYMYGEDVELDCGGKLIELVSLTFK